VAEKLLRNNDRGQARKKERRIRGERARRLVSDNGGEEEEEEDEILPDRLVSSLGLEILGRPLWGAPSNSRSGKRASESALGPGNGLGCGQAVTDKSRKHPGRPGGL